MEEYNALPIITKIESYYLQNKHPKDLYENIKNMTKKDLELIVR